jgi:heme oxygenase
LNLLTLVRERTREQHARLDAALDFDSVTRARYGAFLRAVCAVVTPLEPAIAAYVQAVPGSTRVGCVREDLAALGLPAGGARAACVLPRNLAEAYGCAYVLEGSALGGLVLARAVEKHLGPRTPTSYLRLRGGETPRLWRSWLARLDAFDAHASALERRLACDAACATFDAYLGSFLATGAVREELACSR